MMKRVTLGLFGAWLLHDAEEWFTLAPFSARKAASGGGQVGLPWMRREISEAHAHTAVALVGVVIAAASARGYRTEGRSRFYQAALAGFGLHGFSHLGMTVAERGYTPGVVTAPIVVLPFGYYAHRELARTGVARPGLRTALEGIAVAGGALAASHALAGMLHPATSAATP
ncbi:HXXEE domain-containing protein [Antrihabitans cavernicola]|uniref:HXXEE domain-containing protein n=1 Tax=Antrihabitans cavernicola TaxID=2495913 RepID=A0A5A7SCM9_9NOCA|nr:HXXEE domain-containing protein [Spelaeibacter cavernicola]KAA0022255.1 HXXEE domain-containing protein [Spelaeibacter cavernicola]